MVSFETFVVVQLARWQDRLEGLEQAILRRRNRVDFQNERWGWIVFWAAAEAEDQFENQYLEVIAPSGEVRTKRIRPRWYWRERNKKRREDPQFLANERLRSRLRRRRAKAARAALVERQ